MAQNVYSPKDVDISFGGAINVDGWDSISISRNSENTSKNISADGRLGLTYSADLTGSFEIEVQQQNSAVNTFCSGIQQLQDIAGKPYFYDITISDKSGGVLTWLKGAFLDMPANQDLSSEAGSRTWMFYVENVQYSPDPLGTLSTEVANALAAVNTIASNTTNLVV
tara:strand:- start:22614 stop:23114 length:501 start_codon:yes stop_codon:yes gene_type:complete